MGIQNFYIEQLLECRDTELDKFEIYYIQKYNSFENGYNSTAGGRFHQLNYKHKQTLRDINNLIEAGYTKEEISIKLNLSKAWLSTAAKFNDNNGKNYGNSKRAVTAFDIVNNKLVQIYTFESVMQAFNVFYMLGLCANNKGNFYTRIKESCLRHNIAFGYRWMDTDSKLDDIDLQKIKNIKLDKQQIISEEEDIHKVRYVKSIYKCKYCSNETTNSTQICNSCTQVIAKGKSIKPSYDELMEMLNRGMLVKDIAKMYDRSPSTVSTWIYSDKSSRTSSKTKDVKVKCVELNMIFDSYKQAALYLSIIGKVEHGKNHWQTAYSISKAVKNNRKYKNLTWILVDQPD